jgi:benzoate membrane transport protein
LTVSKSLPPFQTVTTGRVVAVVGFFSSFPILLQGLNAMQADAAQSAAGLMAAAISMGLAGIVLSLWRREPVSVAWSTPGVALLAVSAAPESGFAGAVGAFLFAGLLTVIAGLWKPLSRLAAAIPASIAQAMLAGVLLSLCLVPFRALAEAPAQAAPIILTWFIAGRVNRLAAVPAAVIAAAIVIYVDAGSQLQGSPQWISPPVWVTPSFSLSTLVGIGVPLFIVTMATQNIPGVAVMRSYGYGERSGPLVAAVGGFSVLSAPLGAPATCLAAITAAMCANEDSHPDPRQRYWTAVFAGGFYCLLGLFSAVITGFVAFAPPLVVGTLAGVALLGVLGNSAAAAFEQPQDREAAVMTFLITASGVTILGMGGAVWGLLAGCAIHIFNTRLRR